MVPDLQPLSGQSDFHVNRKFNSLIAKMEWSNHGDVLLLALNRKDKNTAEILRFRFDGKSLTPVDPRNPIEIPAQIASFAWHPSDQLVAIGTKDGAAIFYDFITGQTKPVIGHDGAVLTLAWSIDGFRLFTSADDRILRVWAYNPDGRYKLTSIITLRHDTGEIYTIGVCPDGKGIYTAGVEHRKKNVTQ